VNDIWGYLSQCEKSKKRTFEYTIKRRFGSEFMAGRRNFYLRLVRKF